MLPIISIHAKWLSSGPLNMILVTFPSKPFSRTLDEVLWLITLTCSFLLDTAVLDKINQIFITTRENKTIVLGG